MEKEYTNIANNQIKHKRRQLIGPFFTPEDVRVSVPRTFYASDIIETYGQVPQKWSVNRIFLAEGNIRTETQVDGGGIVETALYTRESQKTLGQPNETGWVAGRVQPEDCIKEKVGETLLEIPER